MIRVAIKNRFNTSRGSLFRSCKIDMADVLMEWKSLLH
jgi:hypothetical protein